MATTRVPLGTLDGNSRLRPPTKVKEALKITAPLPVPAAAPLATSPAATTSTTTTTTTMTSTTMLKAANGAAAAAPSAAPSAAPFAVQSAVQPKVAAAKAAAPVKKAAVAAVTARKTSAGAGAGAARAAPPPRAAAPVFATTTTTGGKRVVAASMAGRAATVTTNAAAGALKRTASAAAAAAEPAGKKMRPDWDVRGRLRDMEDLAVRLSDKVGTSDDMARTVMAKLHESEEIARELEQVKTILQQNVQVKEVEHAAIAHDHEELKRKLEAAERDHDEAMASLMRKHRLQLEELQAAHDGLVRIKANLDADLAHARQEAHSLRSTISHQSGTLLELESQARGLKLALAAAEQTNDDKAQQIQALHAAVAEANERVLAMEAKLRTDEAVRRRLHNTILELKGNIRVFCRIRPLLGNERTASGATPLRWGGEGDAERNVDVLQQVESASGQPAQKTIPFTFDKVFGPNSQQGEVFEEISQLVQSALDGYRVCIFAYGQTGSGKTFTMEGPPNGLADPQQRGMIPRAVDQIFADSLALQEKGWKYRMEASFVEIYNETLRDLLGNGEEKKHEIRHVEKSSTTIISDVQLVEVRSPDQVALLLRKASENRAVGKTQSNERSSRSHSVFTLRLNGTNPLTGEKCDGVLNLIDLAGSERLAQSGATGDRLKETQAINKSLSSLADVVTALANKDSHIPYRNSKLTYLLQNSLGGNSKTLMFVNVSPLPAHAAETLCSLRFATKVNACEIGTAKRVLKNA